jgi:hypothetical protein
MIEVKVRRPQAEATTTLPQLKIVAAATAPPQSRSMTRTNQPAVASAEATFVALTHFGPRDGRGIKAW